MGIYRLGRLADAVPGNDPVWRNFRQRDQHKSSLEQSRMGQRQVRFVHRQVVIGEDIDVGRAWAVAFFLGTVAAKPQFDVLRACQQFARTERGLNRNDEIDEMRLVFESPWWRAVVG